MSSQYVFGESRKTSKDLKRFKFTKIVAKLLVLIIIVSAGYIAFDIRRDKKNFKPAVSKVQVIEQVASSQSYNTEFFQFTGENDWILDEKESTKSKFIYRKIRNSLIEHELKIYVNEPNLKLEATRVLPVGIDEFNRLSAGPPSEHCKVTYPKVKGNRNPSLVKLANSSLFCNPDDIAFKLIVGQVNGGNEIKLKRANGEVATYVIYYSDLTFSNTGLDISKIINSFQAK